MLGSAAALVGMTLACRRPPPDCEYDAVERCLWELKSNEVEVGTPPSTDGAESADVVPGVEAPFETWVELESALDELAEWIGSGLEWPVVDARARELCGGPPVVRELESGSTWVCALAQPLEVDGNAMVLEVARGVVSLSAEELTERQSAKLVALVLDSTANTCIGRFESVEGPINQEFQRCALRSGPLLYIGRFPRDVDADRWQVSVAVIDGG